MPKLIVFPGAEDQYEIDLAERERVAIGRDPSSGVVVPRRMASRHHAVIERRAGRYYIRDAESYNSTFVNNRPVREAELIHGDEIRIADRIVRFVEFDGGDHEPGDTLSLPQAPVEFAADDLTLGEADTPPADRLRAPRSSTDDTDPALRTGVLALEEVGRAIAATGPRSPAAASPGAPAALPPGPSAEVVARPPGSAGPRPAAALRPAPARPKPLLSRAQIALLVLSLLAVVAAGARIYRRATHASGGGGDAGISPSPTALAADYAALALALQLSGEERIDRLWQFLSDYPTSEHRELAYTQLLEAGASEVVVCDHAEREDPALLAAGSALGFRCHRP